MTKPKNLKLRGGTWYLHRRVPKRYQSVERRKEILKSLETDSLKLAEIEKNAEWAKLTLEWEAKLAGDTPDAERKYAAALELAAIRGMRFLAASDVVELPTAKLLERVEAVTDRHDAAALLGTVQAPMMTVSKAQDAFWPLAKDQTLGKSPSQITKWQNPRKKAVRNFIAVCGDKHLNELTRDDMLDFREWWLERIQEEGIQPGTANKDFTHFGGVLKLLNSRKRLGLDLGSLLGELSFREDEKRARPPFSSDWIKTKLLAPNALSGLNTEARCVVRAMVNTGARPSELTTLNANTIHLDCETPYIEVKSDGRLVKSRRAKRKIPLLGVSLEAMRESPGGFPRYFDRDGISNTINKFFDDNGLRETAGHSLYSLRHSFEDRMLEAEIDYRIRKDLMGQRLSGEEYGRGATLEQAARLLEPISF